MRTCEEYWEMISAAVDGELTETELSELHAHMASCPDCKSMYDAFLGISDTMTGDLAEPPAELLSGVMLKIQSNQAVNGKKKRRFSVGRIAAMAACLAVIVLGVSQLDLFHGGDADYNNIAPYMRSAADDAAPADAPSCDGADMEGASAPQAPEPAADQNVNEFTGDAANKVTGSDAGENTSAVAGTSQNDALPTSMPNMVFSVPAAEKQFAGIAAVTLYAAEDLAAPLGTATDETTLMEIKTLLTAEEVYSGTDPVEIEASYLLDVADVGGSTTTLRLWTLGDALWYTEGGNRFLASGTLEQLLALLS